MINILFPFLLSWLISKKSRTSSVFKFQHHDWIVKIFCYGRNLWVFLGIRGKLKITFILQNLPLLKRHLKNGNKITIWWWLGFKTSVSANFIFLDIAKEIWEAVCDTYFIKKNAYRVSEVYENLFSLRQGNKSLEDYHSHFKSMNDDFNQYHPALMILKFSKSSMKNYMFVSFFQGSIFNSNNFEDSY